MKRGILIFCLLICQFGFAQYRFESPARVYNLPDTLREISGITMIDQQTIACVQDENGIVFLFDLVSGTISRQVNLGVNGDFEGISVYGGGYLILRSDGVLLHLKDLSKPLEQEWIPTGIPCKDIEGMCLMPGTQHLLLACKSSSRGSGSPDRTVFLFDLETRSLRPDPFLILYDSNLKPLFPSTDKWKGIHPSGISIHPSTGQIFILFAREYALATFSKYKNLEGMVFFDQLRLPQAEGICFLPNGDVVISTEASSEMPARIFVYSERKK